MLVDLLLESLCIRGMIVVRTQEVNNEALLSQLVLAQCSPVCVAMIEGQ